MYNVTQGTFVTPRGRSVTLDYRIDTNDWNTLYSCLNEDEYHLEELRLEGTALDIGGYIGGVTVALLADNPRLRVVTVEALEPNIELLTRNIASLGVDAVSRSQIVHAAAGTGDTATIRYGFTGSEVGTHHAFVGNAVMPEANLSQAKSVEVPGVTLTSLTEQYGPFCFMKIDCEGCEHDVLKDPAAEAIPLIRGELHYPDGVKPLEIVR